MELYKIVIAVVLIKALQLYNLSHYLVQIIRKGEKFISDLYNNKQ